jgi:hypothetical protein
LINDLSFGWDVRMNMNGDTCISNIDNTLATKKRQTITGVRQKASTSHSSINTMLAGYKAWRTTQTTMRRYKYAIRESAHSSGYFNILYIGPLFYGEFYSFLYSS